MKTRKNKGRKINAAEIRFNQDVFVHKISEIPESADKEMYSTEYPKHYVVKSRNGFVFMYLAKGSEAAPREVVVFYTNGRFNGGFGLNFKEAIKMGLQDAICYMY